MVIVLHEDQFRQRLESIQLVLFQRKFPVIPNNDQVAANAACRTLDFVLEPDTADSDLESLLDVTFLRNWERTRGELNDLNVDFALHIPVNGTNNLSIDLRQYCRSVFAYADMLVRRGTYPQDIPGHA